MLDFVEEYLHVVSPPGPVVSQLTRMFMAVWYDHSLIRIRIVAQCNHIFASCDLTNISPHQVAMNAGASEAHVRIKSLSFIETIVSAKPKTVVKLRLLPDILQCITGSGPRGILSVETM